MLFLVRLVVELPGQLTVDERQELRAKEASVAAELAEEGLLVRLWRSATDGSTWGLWEATDQPALTGALGRLPLRPFMSVTIAELAGHANDPLGRRAGTARPPHLEVAVAQGDAAARDRASSTMSAIVKTGHGPGSVALLERPVPTARPGDGAGRGARRGRLRHRPAHRRGRLPDPPAGDHGPRGRRRGGRAAARASTRPGWAPGWPARRTTRCVTASTAATAAATSAVNKTSMGSFVDGGFASHVVVPATSAAPDPGPASATTRPHSANRWPASATCCSTRRSSGPATASSSPGPVRWGCSRRRSRGPAGRWSPSWAYPPTPLGWPWRPSSASRRRSPPTPRPSTSRWSARGVQAARRWRSRRYAAEAATSRSASSGARSRCRWTWCSTRSSTVTSGFAATEQVLAAGPAPAGGRRGRRGGAGQLGAATVGVGVGLRRPAAIGPAEDRLRPAAGGLTTAAGGCPRLPH